MTSAKSDAAKAAEQFWRELFPATLRNAAQTPFYRELWADIDIGSLRWEDLPRLPIVDKSLIRAAGRAAQVREGLICDEVFTSGTTGQSFITVRGDKEQAFVREFFGSVNSMKPGTSLARGLQINNPYHGSLVSIPAPIHFHRIGIYDANSFEHGLQVLLSTHDDHMVEPRCTVLVGLERALRAFADSVRSRFPDGVDTPLRSVVSYSQYVTARWRTFFEGTFRAPVIDRYSLSEIFGGATQNLRCGFLHFDPVVIPEVVARGSNQPIEDEIGVLVLTALFPFQQAQPMVRYSTGDLVLATRRCGCGRGDLAIKPLGRSRFGVPEPGSSRWLVTPADFLEVVDGIEQVRRVPRFLDSPQIRDHHRIGNPRYETRYREEASDVVRIEVVLDVDPELGTDRQETLRRRVVEGLCGRSASLEARIRAGSAIVDVRFSSDINVQLIANSQ